jgi:predicted phage terminase large subunit-like protein
LAKLQFDGKVINHSKQLLDLERVEMEDSLYLFLRSAWKYIDAAPWKDGWPIQAIAEHLQAVVDGDVKRLLINIPPRMGKQVADDTPVLTTEGWKTHGELSVGDRVFHPSGRSANIVAVSDPTPSDVRVEFFDGSVFYCHENHEWTLFNRTTRRFETKETREFLTAPKGRWGITRTGRVKKIPSDDRALYQLPTVEPLQFHEASLSMPPYVLGAWLGDGSTGRPCITHSVLDQPYIDKIVSLGYPISTVSVHKTTGVLTTNFAGSGGRSNPPRMTKELRELGIFTDKRIPRSYLHASIDQRLELLAGLIDTDGTVDKNSRCHFVTCSRGLAEDVIELVRSFGWRATDAQVEPRLSTSGIQGKKPCWVIGFQPDVAVPVALDRKKILRFASRRAIGLKSVTRDPCGKIGRCIQVDAPDGLYLIGRNLVPTHNSSICSVALPAWIWAQPWDGPTSGPGVQLLHASYGDKLALRDSRKCRMLIESPWYQKYWGDRYKIIGDQNTKGRYATDKNGERLITSVGANVTGEGGNIIIVDDPNAAGEEFSEANIEATKDWWDGTMSTRLNDMKTGAFIVIQQRLAEDDLTGHILEKEADEWVHLCLPMKYEPERSYVMPVTGWKDPRTVPGELLWPDRFGDAEVARLERILGKFKAAGQLQQRPEPPGGGVIKRDWWKLWERDVFPPFDFILASLDTAYTTKTENDYSAMTVWGVFSGDAKAVSIRDIDSFGRPMFSDRIYTEEAPKVMLMFAWQKQLELHELVHEVAKTCKRLKVDKLIIENKAAGHSVSQELRRLYQNEKFAVQLYDPKSQDKLSRLYSVQHLFSEGMVYAPDKAWAEMTITQVAQFPKGKHDDVVDTVSQSLRHLRDIGLLTRSEERVQEIESMKTYPGGQPTALYPV